MIDQMSFDSPVDPAHWTQGTLIGFDLETTGPDPHTALPVSFAIAEFREGELHVTETGLVNPGVPIPFAASEVHGIHDADIADAVQLKDFARPMIGRLVKLSKAGVPVVGMNIRYDLTIMDVLARHYFGAGLEELGWHGPVVDALVLDRRMDPFRRGKRRLTELAEHYMVGLDDAHEAGADAEAAVKIVVAIANEYAKVGDLSLLPLHDAQVIWYRTWADDFSRYRVRKGDDPLAEEEREWPISLRPE